MPYPNEYTARINSPDKYKSIRRENDKFGQGIDVIWGILPDGKTEIQSIHFKSNKFSSNEEVKKWLSEHNFNAIEFFSPSKKGDSFFRFDTSGELRLQKTSEGFLKGTARVTRTGVFTYRNADGTTHKELRLPEEVFRNDSLESMKMIPIVNEHPSAKIVTVDTARDLAIGYTGENIQQDGSFVISPVTITTRDGVDAIENGKRELSLGYEVELEDSPGIYNGDSYDCIQRNIKYNHLAITTKGRAGAEVKLNIDNFDAIEVDHKELKSDNNFMKGSVMPAKVILDGIEYESSPEVAKALDKAKNEIIEIQKKVDAGVKTSTELQAKLDTATDQVKSLQTKLDDKSAFQAAVKNRINLEKTAFNILDEETKKKIDSMSDEDIKKAVVLSKFPSAKLDGMSIDYINARFDSALECSTDIDSQRKAVNNDKSNKNDGCGSSDEKRKKMIEEMKNQYKK